MKSKKLKRVEFNNRKKQIMFVYASGKMATLHYGHFGIDQSIVRAWIDKETAGKSVGLEFADETTDYIPYDQPLAAVHDPEYLLQQHIELIISHIKDALKVLKFSKRYLAEQLKTSDNQIQRLLNPAIPNKNLSQLYAILAIVGLEPEWRVRKAA